MLRVEKHAIYMAIVRKLEQGPQPLRDLETLGPRVFVTQVVDRLREKGVVYVVGGDMCGRIVHYTGLSARIPCRVHPLG